MGLLIGWPKKGPFCVIFRTDSVWETTSLTFAKFSAFPEKDWGLSSEVWQYFRRASIEYDFPSFFPESRWT